MLSLDNSGKLIAIVGPTGSGKSDLAVRLAKIYDGEVINADSRQLYRFLDIGVAKPTISDRGGIPHHLFDIIDPDKDFNLADYQKITRGSIKNVQSQNKLPFLVGGSGLYVWSVLEGWQIPQVPPNWELRQEMEEMAKSAGPEILYQRLVSIDPVAAEQIDSRNVRRVIRALEIGLSGGVKCGESQRKQPPPYHILVIGLTAERKALYDRVDLRIDKMIESGLVDEVRSLLAQGYAPDIPALKSVGYKEVISHITGEMDLTETVERIKAETHRLIRHQNNWFRLNDTRIHWLDIQQNYVTKCIKLMEEFLKEESNKHGFY
ncbi:tRNA dimethylallyltransferase [Dehalogenimonas sp. WBC-2]|nr:tRNA dimethylallyltransferase [Dehalogenimonas sp. WBC-2]